MPITLPATFDSREEPNSTDAYIWFVRVVLQKPYRIDPSTIAPALIAQIASVSETTAWPLNGPSYSPWEPFNFQISAINANQEGDLPSVQLTVDNVGRVLMQHLHNGEGLEGNAVTMFLVPTSSLLIDYPNEEFRRFDFEIASASADDEVVSFKLERANFFTRQTPQDRFSARRCRWLFGGQNCGYIQNTNAAYTTCDKSLSDCSLRGADHAARGLAVIHPQRFGAFPGIPKQR
tara:strand:+ start:202 stop:903 length:702 start_codon:yes stop_codon:yes gene_type:complete